MLQYFLNGRPNIIMFILCTDENVWLNQLNIRQGRLNQYLFQFSLKVGCFNNFLNEITKVITLLIIIDYMIYTDENIRSNQVKIQADTLKSIFY